MEPGARHGEQLGVALAQPLAAAQPQICPGDQPQYQVTGRRSQRACGKHLRIEDERSEQAGDDQRQGQGVRKDPAPRVDPGQCQEPPAQQAIEPGCLGLVDRQRNDRHGEGGQLDARVEPADRAAARPAPPASHDPADQRNELTRSQRRATALAGGARPDDRPAFRQAPDQDPEKAADERCRADETPARRTEAPQIIERRHACRGAERRSAQLLKIGAFSPLPPAWPVGPSE